MSRKNKALGVFSLAMITAGSVDSIRNLPTTALFGPHLIFFFVLAAIFFLLPSALVSAELASTSKRDGGVFAWVTDAFGLKTGFLAVWFQWIENVIWYPAILSTLAGTIAYSVSPASASHPLFLIITILASFWIITWINIRGMKASARVANICSVFGLLLPMSLIIGLAAFWLLLGKPSQIHLTWHNIIPHHLGGTGLWVAMIGFILSFCGMEIATVHSRETKNPQRAYPRAMLLATVIILVTLMSGSLAIGVVLPTKKISLVSGIMQAFDAFFSAYHLSYILPLVGAMLIIGLVGTVNNWVIAPTRGLAYAMAEINSGSRFAKLNKHGAPARLLIAQALLVSVISLLYKCLPSVNEVYWLFSALSSQLYVVMYVLMFAAAIWLRLKPQPRREGFMIPGGLPGIVCVCLLGLIGSVFTFFIGFFPPDGIPVGSAESYKLVITIGLILMALIPWIWVACKKTKGETN